MISKYNSTGKRFGKKRVPGCKCEYNFTCRACLNAHMQEGMLQLPSRAYRDEMWARSAVWKLLQSMKGIS